jgi:hypothetical protein
MASVARAGTLPAAVIEVDRIVDINGNAELAKHRLRIGGELARRKVVLRLDGHLIHVVYNDVLAKTLPGPISVRRKVPRDGVSCWPANAYVSDAPTPAKIVTIHVEDTHFRVTRDGAQLSVHPRTTELPIRRWKAKIHAPRPNST